MLVQSKWPHGEHEVQCSQVQVPVHETCKCGCRLRREDCNKHQYYHEPSCRYNIIFLSERFIYCTLCRQFETRKAKL